MTPHAITAGDLDDPKTRALIERHVARARAETGRGSDHALGAEELRSPAISLWTIRDGDEPIGIGALQEIAPGHGEIKSMHTVEGERRRGVAAAILAHIVAEAKRRGYARLSLETGSWDYFDPARAFYREHGFEECEPFGDYILDPNSVFMTMNLAR